MLFVFSQGYVLCGIVACTIFPVLSFLTMEKMLLTYLFHVLKFVVCDLLCFEMLPDDFCEEGDRGDLIGEN